ncbi:WD40 repeat-like protein [Fistulina hepatica ATCC 64428]|nr:WD40 repeat-like protein [Fistulina hepatica ATCC 64428]
MACWKDKWNIYKDVPTCSSKVTRYQRHALSSSLQRPLDRLNVLGDDNGKGHTGCVNALSWAKDGELLLSGGDDKTVRIWRADPFNEDDTQIFPFACASVIQTGHRSNIFNAKMLPHSNRIVTVARDSQIRVHDIGDPYVMPYGEETVYSTQEAGTRVFKCHHQAVKRIVAEDSPDLFISVSEDGTVRQHDLRAPHACRAGCPTPLVKMGFELFSMSISPMAPHAIVVAGESPYGYLFDRRYGRSLEIEWGMLPPLESNYGLTKCVRRFGRDLQKREDSIYNDHVTGVQISKQNGHETTDYSADAVYLFSTRDDPVEAKGKGSVLTPHTGSNQMETAGNSDEGGTARSDVEMDQSGDQDDNEDAEDPSFAPGVPYILPRRRFVGARNVRTVKDVNFLGPDDEFVTSGSDDGNFFIWRKDDGVLVDILEGDATTVNVIEGHPHLPCVAVSGIDTTVKIFGPAQPDQPRKFSRMQDADNVIAHNGRQIPYTVIRRADLIAHLALARQALATSEGGEESELGCSFQ